jgi:hypothetical protein
MLWSGTDPRAPCRPWPPGIILTKRGRSFKTGCWLCCSVVFSGDWCLTHARDRALNGLPQGYFTRPHMDHIGTFVPISRLPGTYRPMESGHCPMTRPCLPMYYWSRGSEGLPGDTGVTVSWFPGLAKPYRDASYNTHDPGRMPGRTLLQCRIFLQERYQLCHLPCYTD